MGVGQDTAAEQQVLRAQWEQVRPLENVPGNYYITRSLTNAFRRVVYYYENPREMFLFFYYPADAYISFLMTVEELEFYDEIECDDLFAGDSRERIMIFQLPDYEI